MSCGKLMKNEDTVTAVKHYWWWL